MFGRSLLGRMRAWESTEQLGESEVRDREREGGDG